MNVWAITGGVACGKSTVARLFADLGAEIRDADADAREARADPEIRARIREAFGTVEPSELATAIYADPNARTELNGIVHPEVRKRMRAAIDAARSSPARGLLLYEVPLLFEGSLEAWFDGAICAYCPPDVQRARLAQRHPELTEDQLDERLAAQLPVEEKVRRSQIAIHTDGTLDETRARVKACFRQLSE